MAVAQVIEPAVPRRASLVKAMLAQHAPTPLRIVDFLASQQAAGRGTVAKLVDRTPAAQPADDAFESTRQRAQWIMSQIDQFDRLATEVTGQPVRTAKDKDSRPAGRAEPAADVSPSDTAVVESSASPPTEPPATLAAPAAHKAAAARGKSPVPPLVIAKAVEGSDEELEDDDDDDDDDDMLNNIPALSESPTAAAVTPTRKILQYGPPSPAFTRAGSASKVLLSPQPPPVPLTSPPDLTPEAPRTNPSGIVSSIPLFNEAKAPTAPAWSRSRSSEDANARPSARNDALPRDIEQRLRQGRTLVDSDDLPAARAPRRSSGSASTAGVAGSARTSRQASVSSVAAVPEPEQPADDVAYIMQHVPGPETVI